METYSDDNDEHTLYRLEIAESEEEQQQVLEEAKQSREKLEGNIDKKEMDICTITSDRTSATSKDI